jgi:hypothetical protein
MAPTHPALTGLNMQDSKSCTSTCSFASPIHQPPQRSPAYNSFSKPPFTTAFPLHATPPPESLLWSRRSKSTQRSFCSWPRFSSLLNPHSQHLHGNTTSPCMALACSTLLATRTYLPSLPVFPTLIFSTFDPHPYLPFYPTLATYPILFPHSSPFLKLPSIGLAFIGTVKSFNAFQA